MTACLTVLLGASEARIIRSSVVLNGTDCGQRDVGISLAVATMQKGERCRLRVQPQYGYGKQGAQVATIAPLCMHP